MSKFEQSYKKHMIVYEKDDQRIQNFQQLNRLFNQTINKFSAIDTINEFDQWLDYALKNNCCTEHYLERHVAKEGKGKLGCNLSHLLLYERILAEQSSNDPKWHLIMEDDVGVDLQTEQELAEKLTALINNLSKLRPDTQFVQLCVYSRFSELQLSAPRLFGSIHIKIPQWGTCAYLIHVDGIQRLLDNKPWDLNIDYFINSMDAALKSVCYINPYFYARGAESSTDIRTEKQMGSLIWESSST